MARTKLVGDWGRAQAWFTYVRTGQATRGIARDLREVGNKTKEKIQEHIRLQDLNWDKLAEATVRKKKGDKVYFETGAYYNSVKVKVSAPEENGFRLVIAPIGKHPSGIDMAELAKWLEYGTYDTPSRPLWRPVYLEIQDLPEFQFLTQLSKRFGFHNV